MEGIDVEIDADNKTKETTMGIGMCVCGFVYI
jgi:hypothetical protein